MSQKKVDLYKEQKANRSKIIKKEKRMRRIEQIVVSVVAIAAAGWICFSVYNKVTDKGDAENSYVSTDVNITALEDFSTELSGLTAE